MPVISFKPDSWWFKRWEEEHGLSMRKANRKYQVPRAVLKRRLEIFWVNLFRLRQFAVLALGYEPAMMNWDQSPFHHNETGAQDKPLLGVRGALVPIVEGNSDTKSRWTANLTTMSNFTAVAGGAMPPCECMFKAEVDGSVDTRLQAFLRNSGFPSWFTVTVGPKGSYREQDIISFLQKHLDPWREGRDWRILLADDYSAHKTDNVWNLCWSRGYILLIHGGGSTPVGQTVDTDLNEHGRRLYGNKETRLLLEKMRAGVNVPKLAHEECMRLMYEVMSDPQLHLNASEGYKKVGQSVDLHGREDTLICREAGAYWNSETTDSYPNMRAKIDEELTAVADEVRSGGIKWCQRDVRRLITPYPLNKKVDSILANLGDDYYHDGLHALSDGDDGAADEEAVESISSESDCDGGAAVAEGQFGAAVAVVPEHTDVDSAPLSASQADAVHHVRTTIAALEITIADLRAMGQIRGVQCIEAELDKLRRQQRALIKESPAVADSFLRLRRAERQADLERNRIYAEQTARKRQAAKAVDDRDAAVAELRKTRRTIQDMEGIRQCTHAIKTFTLDSLGAGITNAGGPKAKKNRHEVLDRLARYKAGLSAGQRNDWSWFKESWDQAMVSEHKAGWAALFSSWVQRVLDDERSNAFSHFVFNETSRVFHGATALHVPGN
jgi:hypothetical protein